MTEFVTTEVRGGIGYLTLNRPQALNALSLDMIRAITQALQTWAAAPEVVAVVVAARRQGFLRWWRYPLFPQGRA